MRPRLNVVFLGKSTSIEQNRFQEITVKKEDFINSKPTQEIEVPISEFLDDYLDIFKEKIEEYDVSSIEELMLAFSDFCEELIDITSITNFPIRYNNKYILLSFTGKTNEGTYVSNVDFSIYDPNGNSNEEKLGVNCGCNIPYLYTDNYQCDAFEIVTDIVSDVNTSITKDTYNCRFLKTLQVRNELEDFGRYPLNQIHIILDVAKGKDEIGVRSLRYAEDVYSPLEFLKLIDMDSTYKHGTSKLGLMYYHKFSFEDVPETVEPQIKTIKSDASDIQLGQEATITIEFADEFEDMAAIPDKEVFIWSNMYYQDAVERICEGYNIKCIRHPGIMYFNQDRAIPSVDFKIKSLDNVRIKVLVNGSTYVEPENICIKR